MISIQLFLTSRVQLGLQMKFLHRKLFVTNVLKPISLYLIFYLYYFVASSSYPSPLHLAEMNRQS